MATWPTQTAWPSSTAWPAGIAWPSQTAWPSQAVGTLRESATRTALPLVKFVSANLSYNSWKGQVARSPIAAISVAWTNWCVSSGVETTSGGVETINAGIEFPIGGTVTQLTFNAGATSIAIADGLEGVSDLVTLPRAIPCMLGTPTLTFAASGQTITRNTGSWLTEGYLVGDTVGVDGTASNNGPAVITTLTAAVMTCSAGIIRGAAAGVATPIVDETVAGTVGGIFRVRFRRSNTNAVLYTNSPCQDLAMFDRNIQSSTDFTLSGSFVDDGGGNVMWPARIMGVSSVANDVCLIEDSRGNGAGETIATQDGCGNCGQTARSLGPHHSVFRLQQGGGTIQGFAAGHVRQSRLAALAPPTNVVIVMGYNDISGNLRTAAQVEADIVTAAATFSSTTHVYVGTIYPHTTSLDSWATTLNQTVFGQEAIRVAVNTWIRALTTAVIPNFAGFLEIANALETAQNSGIYKATGGTGQAAYTIDGVHASTLGDKLVTIAIP